MSYYFLGSSMLALNLMKDPCIKHNASPSCLENSDPHSPLWGPLSRPISRHLLASPASPPTCPCSSFLSPCQHPNLFSHPPHPFFHPFFPYFTISHTTLTSLSLLYILHNIIALYPDDILWFIGPQCKWPSYLPQTHIVTIFVPAGGFRGIFGAP